MASSSPFTTTPYTEDDFIGDDNIGEFIVAARKAFGIMMRLGWWPQNCHLGWFVQLGNEANARLEEAIYWPDPFTALIEADKWYTENVENKP